MHGGWLRTKRLKIEEWKKLAHDGERRCMRMKSSDFNKFLTLGHFRNIKFAYQICYGGAGR